MISKLNHVFVESIPDELDEGVLYISTRFRVIMHLCCCGCKNKVVTPLSPARWRMTFDGKTISLSPSIGNWNFECKSHYWIQKSQIEWAGNWTEDEIALGKAFERKKRSQYFEKSNTPDDIIIKENSKGKKKSERSNFFKSVVNKFKNK